jgi:hypothetical protein
MTATLRVTRAAPGIELRRGTFTVAVDGKDVGTIEHNDTIERPVTPGHHALQMTNGRYRSHEQGFDASDGEVVTFRCHGTRIWPLYVASIVKPDIAISLKRE